MAKIDYVEFQARTQPLAFLITFRCYGTWLHGDERGAVDRSSYHRYGTPDMLPIKGYSRMRRWNSNIPLCDSILLKEKL
jgi:hypothetical protein